MRGAAGMLAAALLASACGVETSPGRPNVVLVSIDSLRADHLGAYGYGPPTSPFIDRLAAGGVTFEQAVSTTSWTLPAHAAMFTGLYDTTHGLVDNGQRLADGHRTLAELFADGGYETAGFYAGPYLHPAFGLAQGFETYRSCMAHLPDGADGADARADARAMVSDSHRGATGPATVARVAEWAAAREAQARPFFLFLHLWDVHYDYDPPREYVEIFDPDYDGDLDGRDFTRNPRLTPSMPARDLQHLVALYDGEIRYTDETLRRILAGLGERGMLENTLIVVTADHGEEFFEHGGKGHQRTLFDEVLRVPLIFHWEGALPAGARVARQVRLIDLLPTLAAAADLPAPPVQGRDLGPLIRGEALPPAPALAELLAEGLTLRALREEGRKVLRLRDGLPAVLFRLDRDPAERRPLGPRSPANAERRAAARRLAAELDRARAFREALDVGTGDRQPIPRELRERLESLGYVDSGKPGGG